MELFKAFIDFLSCLDLSDRAEAHAAVQSFLTDNNIAWDVADEISADLLDLVDSWS